MKTKDENREHKRRGEQKLKVTEREEDADDRYRRRKPHCFHPSLLTIDNESVTRVPLLSVNGGSDLFFRSPFVPLQAAQLGKVSGVITSGRDYYVVPFCVCVCLCF